MYNGQKVGEVEIRHSRKCATVWSRVKNLSGATAQVKEAIVLFSDSNGNGRVEHWYPTTDTVVNNGYGWSNQYRDRASFAARGGIFYAGAWRYAETPRTVAWVQYKSNYADHPYACSYTQAWPCERWPTSSTGQSVTRLYRMISLTAMPTASGGTRDVTGDVNFMFAEFNSVAASHPKFFSTINPEYTDVVVQSYYECGVAARAGGTTGSNGYYTHGVVKLSTCANWGSVDNTRATLCHEIDHLLGLAHVWTDDSQGVNNIGSKATCIGMSSPAGPRIDDVSALNAVYSGAVP
jgi:hypothetical protein